MNKKSMKKNLTYYNFNNKLISSNWTMFYLRILFMNKSKPKNKMTMKIDFRWVGPQK